MAVIAKKKLSEKVDVVNDSIFSLENQILELSKEYFDEVNKKDKYYMYLAFSIIRY